MCEVLNNVVNVISGLDGVLEVRQLSNDDILKIIDINIDIDVDVQRHIDYSIPLEIKNSLLNKE